LDTHVSIADVCDLLGMSRWTVAKYIKDGELAAVRVRRSVRISVESYQQFLDRHTVARSDQRTTTP